VLGLPVWIHLGNEECVQRVQEVCVRECERERGERDGGMGYFAATERDDGVCVCVCKRERETRDDLVRILRTGSIRK